MPMSPGDCYSVQIDSILNTLGQATGTWSSIQVLCDNVSVYYNCIGANQCVSNSYSLCVRYNSINRITAIVCDTNLSCTGTPCSKYTLSSLTNCVGLYGIGFPDSYQAFIHSDTT